MRRRPSCRATAREARSHVLARGIDRAHDRVLRKWELELFEYFDRCADRSVGWILWTRRVDSGRWLSERGFLGYAVGSIVARG